MLKRYPGTYIYSLFLFVLTVAGSSLLYKVEPKPVVLAAFPVIVLFMDSFFPNTSFRCPCTLLFLVSISAYYRQLTNFFLINIHSGGVAVFCIPSFWGSGWQQFLSLFWSLLLIWFSRHFLCN